MRELKTTIRGTTVSTVKTRRCLRHLEPLADLDARAVVHVQWSTVVFNDEQDFEAVSGTAVMAIFNHARGVMRALVGGAS